MKTSEPQDLRWSGIQQTQEPPLQIDEVVELDLLTLREHTERAGDTIDTEMQRKSIKNLLQISEIATVRRDGALVGYAMLHPKEDGCWFVTGFNTHPSHRNARVFKSLFAQIGEISSRCGIRTLRSNVYKTNHLSMAFHSRLGFRVTKENAKGVEFTAKLEELRPIRLSR
jgi:hypothetical protein